MLKGQQATEHRPAKASSQDQNIPRGFSLELSLTGPVLGRCAGFRWFWILIIVGIRVSIDTCMIYLEGKTVYFQEMSIILDILASHAMLGDPIPFYNTNLT